MPNRVKLALRRLIGQPSRGHTEPDDIRARRPEPDDTSGARRPEPDEMPPPAPSSHSRRLTPMPVIAMLEPEREIAKIGVRLLDEAYMTWFTASIGAEQALRAWFDATPGDGSPAYFAYCAALDREEAAARDLQRLWEVSEPDREALERSAR